MVQLPVFDDLKRGGLSVGALQDQYVDYGGVSLRRLSADFREGLTEDDNFLCLWPACFCPVHRFLRGRGGLCPAGEGIAVERVLLFESRGRRTYRAACKDRPPHQRQDRFPDEF